MLSLAVIMAAGPALSAADWTGGAQLFLGLPTSDLSDSVQGHVGGDLKLYGLVDLGQGHAIRPELDGLMFQGKPKSISGPDGRLSSPDGTKVTVTMGSLGACYLYFLNGTASDAGPYAGAGLGVSRNRVEFKVPDSDNSTATTTKAYYSLVVGYQFDRHWNIEAGYRYTKWGSSSDQFDVNYTMPTFLLGGGFRF